ncbi:hypothetical protein [Myxococcus qinghaiensis]|uniref:hypothetical protein n=1 Tax=Myxococcus qinghaiensis TaxID=2906758 RepID=UPI0020A708FC|nr:hypothetical protein [Myxococcus qinghaiensis]MCP3167933.1 hypothetical protein [Myxococcus qinghaiensis]
MRNKVLVLLGLVLVCGITASVLCHNLWGYYITPPSGASVIASSRRLEALTRFRVDPGGKVERVSGRPIIPSEFVGCTLFDFDSRCMNDRLMAAVLTLPGDTARAEPLESLRHQIERTCGEWSTARWGVAISVQDAAGPARLISCTAGEVTNDRYAHREVLFSESGEREVAFFWYEVSGLEFLTVTFLFITLMFVSCGLLACGWGAWKLRKLLAEPT